MTGPRPQSAATSGLLAAPQGPQYALANPPSATPPMFATPPAAFSLSPATEPFPQRLVSKILAGHFVDMREMLTDNISLLQQMEPLGSQMAPCIPGTMRPRLREVATLATWAYCFLAYVAIRSSDPRVRDWLAYARLVIREAQLHGGSSFLDYDRVFRQQAALDHAMPWNCLHPGIQAATLVGRPTGISTFCTLCREPDHTREGCALAYLQQPLAQQPGPAITPQNSAVPTTRPNQRVRIGTPAAVCISWNRGACKYPNSCRFRHICATCFSRHAARDCSRTPPESEYRRELGQPAINPPQATRQPRGQPRH